MPRKPLGFNTYRVIDGVAHLDLTDRQGNVKATTLIDAADLPLLIEYGGRWCAGRVNDKKTYVMRNNNRGGVKYLHHLLLGVPAKGMTIDHLNGDSLDNRRSNLRTATLHENGQNREGAQRNNKLGVRNVTYRGELRKPYLIQIGITKGRKALFYCRVKTLNIARITAEMARVQHWGTEAA